MKKSMIFMGCLALLMAGCNKIEHVEVPAEEPVVESPDHLVIDIKVGTEGETRAIKKAWEVGDKVYVFFDHFFLDYLSNPDIGTTGYSNDVCYLTLTYDGFTWQSDFSQSALEAYLSGQSSGTLAAIYYQHLDPQYRCLHGRRSNKEEFYVSLKNPGQYSGFYLFSQGDTYTVSNGKLSATLNMHPHEHAVRLFIPGMPKSTRFGFGMKCSQLVREIPEVISSVNMNGEGFQAPTVQTSTDGVLYPSFEESPASAQMVFYGRLKSADYVGQPTEYVLQLTDKRGKGSKDDLYYTFRKTATLWGKEEVELPQLTDDSKWVRSYKTPGIQDLERGFHSGREWVLMGDGRKWAARNFFDSDWFTDGSADGTGGMFLDWEDANKAFNNGSWDGWRLPTYNELMDLLSAKTTHFSKDYDDDGHFRGMWVERWNDAGTYAVDHIFLPSSYGYQKFVNGSWITYGEPDGFYWTATIPSGFPKEAWSLELKENAPEDDPYPFRVAGMDRSYQMFARAILDE